MALTMAAAIPAEAAEPVELMVLGTHRFDDPRLDLNNIQAEDVPESERQAEPAPSPRRSRRSGRP